MAAQKFPTVFISLRYAEAEAEGKLVQAALARHGISAYINNSEAGGDLYDEIPRALQAASVYVVMASQTYGVKTSSLVCTYYEMQSIMAAVADGATPPKEMVLVRMIPPDQHFVEPLTEMVLGVGRLKYIYWPKGSVIPVDLIDAIATKIQRCTSSVSGVVPYAAFAALSVDESRDWVANGDRAGRVGRLTEAAKWYRKAAEQGNAEGQNELGLLYVEGEGVPQVFDQAFSWFRRAAEQGYAKAQCNLGTCYADAEGVPEDYCQAVFWYRKAADQGLAQAQFNLANCYANGEGVPQDMSQAAFWYRKAADQEHMGAQVNLGLCYSDGDGVCRDASQAAFWYRKAAEQGDDEAQHILGVCYCEGKGVRKDFSQAVVWFRRAADQGHPGAQHNLGVCYDNGDGVLRSTTYAAFWYRKAADQGYKAAKRNLRRLRCFTRMR